MSISQRGVSLVELMIAITLGLVLVLGLVQFFVSSKQGYRIQESTGQMQENARFALDYLGREIRMADFWPGVEASAISAIPANLADSTATPCSTAWMLAYTQPIQGYEGGTKSPLGGCTKSLYIADSDVIVIRYADPGTRVETATLQAPGPGDAEQLDADGPYYLRTQIGRSARLFDYAASTKDAIDALPGDESDAIFNFKYRAAVFYLGNFTSGGVVTPTLYRKNLSSGGVGNAEPLVEGIEHVRYAYGLDVDGDGSVDRYAAAAELASADWANVSVVRVGLIVQGDTLDSFTDTDSYAMPDGSSYTPPTNFQRYQRRLFISDIQIRNRTRA